MEWGRPELPIAGAGAPRRLPKVVWSREGVRRAAGLNQQSGSGRRHEVLAGSRSFLFLLRLHLKRERGTQQPRHPTVSASQAAGPQRVTAPSSPGPGP